MDEVIHIIQLIDKNVEFKSLKENDLILGNV